MLDQDFEALQSYSHTCTLIVFYEWKGEIKFALYCFTSGDYQAAIDEHEMELTTCQALTDSVGEAVANRKLGECYMELEELETAEQVSV